MSTPAMPVEFANGLLWYMAEDDTYLIGITQGGLDSIGSIVGIDYSEINDEFATDDWIGEIAGKDANLEISAPFALQIDTINNEVSGDFGLIEDDPTGDAWIYRVRKLD